MREATVTQHTFGFAQVAVQVGFRHRLNAGDERLPVRARSSGRIHHFVVNARDEVVGSQDRLVILRADLRQPGVHVTHSFVWRCPAP